MTPVALDLVRATHHVGRGLFHALAELGAVRMAPPRDPREAAHRLAGAVGAVARAHDMVVHVEGDVPRGPALIVANHVSYLDPIAILPVCPAIPISKGEVSEWPVIGTIAHVLGVEFVQRRQPYARVRTLRRVHALLARGVPVLNFPEGTTTRGDKVLPFLRGTFGIAQRLGVPVVPVALRYRDPAIAWCDSATFLPHYLRTASRRNIEVTLGFGAAMSIRGGELPEDMAARARNAIKKTLERWNDAGIRSRVSAARPDPVLPAARRVA
jgi:1-acyl-sn-glycerol-3-phosphate acyltransferase